MKRIFILLPVFIGVLYFPGEESAAQGKKVAEAGRRYLGVQIGGLIASYRENLVVPLSFDGPGFLLGGIYTSESNENVFQIRLKIDMGFLANRYAHEAYVAGAELRGFWLHKLTRNRRYGELWGGISIPLQMTNLFIDSWDDSHLYWLTAHGVGAAAEWRKTFPSKKTIAMHIEFPLISIVSRPPEYRYNKQDALNHLGFHLTEPNRRFKLETPESYRAVLVQTVFRHPIRRSLINLGLEFRYVWCRIPKDITGLRTSIFLSYQWRIR